VLVALNVSAPLTPQLLREGLERAAELVISDAVDIDVTAVLPLAQAAEAHRAFENRSAVGKFILAV
jgi:NADPH2:quinone reductase